MLPAASVSSKQCNFIVPEIENDPRLLSRQSRREESDEIPLFLFGESAQQINQGLICLIIFFGDA